MKEISTFNVVDYLTDEVAIEAYLSSAAESNDAHLLEQALLDVKHARLTRDLKSPAR